MMKQEFYDAEMYALKDAADEALEDAIKRLKATVACLEVSKAAFVKEDVHVKLAMLQYAHDKLLEAVPGYTYRKLTELIISATILSQEDLNRQDAWELV